MLKNYKFAILYFCWMVFITYLSLGSVPDTTGGININIPHFDKLVHFTFYLVSTILGGFFLNELRREKTVLLKATFIMMIVAVVYGMVVEVLQYNFTTDRHGDVLDFLANSIGAISGFVAMKYLILGVLSQK
ncbi:VanZ family protein [Cellulophaga sp. 1_MG-2023]|uniref:VanZ family protein n=1 Tax=Cellulophaga baltica TaxID=76594 RepID=UPI0026E1E577|nr:VanZ family protein [Cellulophaga sp. 1_MG-2023]MDO6766603.1 VanZ family protein [Cellulophaga sp. 1_MG-2023]